MSLAGRYLLLEREVVGSPRQEYAKAEAEIVNCISDSAKGGLTATHGEP